MDIIPSHIDLPVEILITILDFAKISIIPLNNQLRSVGINRIPQKLIGVFIDGYTVLCSHFNGQTFTMFYHVDDLSRIITANVVEFPLLRRIIHCEFTYPIKGLDCTIHTQDVTPFQFEPMKYYYFTNVH